MNFEQLRQFAPQISLLAQKHGITRVFVFGSVARGETNKKSDVDLLVEMQAGVSLFEMAGFSYETEKLLQVSVDVVPFSLLSEIKDQDFVQNIQKEAIAL